MSESSRLNAELREQMSCQPRVSSVHNHSQHTEILRLAVDER